MSGLPLDSSLKANADSAEMEIIDVESSSSSSVYESSSNEMACYPYLSTRTRPVSERIAHALKKLTQNSNMKFMENFDPERSNREKRKLSRKVNSGGKRNAVAYDEKGILVANGKDLCDCMNSDCPGCHFPCLRCQSSKCGHECRVNRKWTYEEIEVDGTDIVIRVDEHPKK